MRWRVSSWCWCAGRWALGAGWRRRVLGAGGSHWRSHSVDWTSSKQGVCKEQLKKKQACRHFVVIKKHFVVGQWSKSQQKLVEF
jgi:hypothetical protein